MADLSDMNPTGRFTGRADAYARNRPDYPEAALDFVVAHCGLAPGALLIDVGCGTGIASRQLAGRGLRVLGVEPNADMRTRAEAAPAPPGVPAPTYRAGQAEATGLPDACADAVLSAQAFHWFQPEPTLREFHRILKPGGWAVLLWNERDRSDPFTAAYGVVIRSSRGAAAVERQHGRAGEVLLTSPLFQNASRMSFRHEQWLDEAGLVGRGLSVSYAPQESAQLERFSADLGDVFTRFQRDGRVRLRYNTSVYTGRRRESVSATGSSL
jgi:SAM-dependent methyltransferase